MILLLTLGCFKVINRFIYSLSCKSIMLILKKWWFWAIIILLLIAFFFPKPSGEGGRSGVQLPLPQTWVDKECSCLGFEKTYAAPDAGYQSFCFGLSLTCDCFRNTITGENQKIRTEIECD